MFTPSYTYLANIIKVIDGDTIVVNLDLGCNVWVNNMRLRMLGVVPHDAKRPEAYGIDTPEVHGSTKDAGLAARDYLDSLLFPEAFKDNRRPALIKTYKDKRDSFGRYLAEVFIERDFKILHVGQHLLEVGVAKPYQDK
jgi:micrococcal nuclease